MDELTVTRTLLHNNHEDLAGQVEKIEYNMLCIEFRIGYVRLIAQIMPHRFKFTFVPQKSQQPPCTIRTAAVVIGNTSQRLSYVTA
jgi:hypothetical protein